MINNNLDYEKNSNTTSDTVSHGVTASDAKSVDNGYFNRFDNRIAANLAAVISGARFRSSSCSKTSSRPYTSHISSGSGRIQNKNCNLNSNANANSPRLNANNILSNSSTNLKLSNANVGGLEQYQQHCHLGSSSNNSNSNSNPTVGGVKTPIRRQRPPQHLPLNYVIDGKPRPRPRPDSPLFHCNRNGVGGGCGANETLRRRPSYLFSQVNPNCNDNEKVAQTPSSDEDNSPTELNNCKRLADKPPLVKRLTMGLLRSHEESQPLVNVATSITATDESRTCASPRANSASLTGKQQTVYSYGYINEEAFEPDKFIASKFGDSCRQSLTAIPMLDTLNLNDNSEFNLKKRYLRETSSANSSPKIFGNRLRGNATAAATATATCNNPSVNTSLASSSADDDESELKDACWFQAGISREIACEVLSSKSPGAFLVRRSSSKSGCYALTLRVPSPPGPKIANYIILRTPRGYKINGFRKEFTSLRALITHHSVMPELLPIPLAMPRPTNMTSSRRNLDDFDTYDSLQMLLKYLRAKNLENGE